MDYRVFFLSGSLHQSNLIYKLSIHSILNYPLQQFHYQKRAAITYYSVTLQIWTLPNSSNYRNTLDAQEWV